MPYELPPLPYAPDALAPVIDAETMQLHHGKHHRAYVAALNEALTPYPDWQGLTIEDLMRRLGEVPEAIRNQVRNQGGGHANHQLFWKIMHPGRSQPSGALLAQIERDFGSLAAMKVAFQEAGMKRFGSGWCSSCSTPKRKSSALRARPTRTARCCSANPPCSATTSGSTPTT